MLKPVFQSGFSEIYEFYFEETLAGNLAIHWSNPPSIWSVKIEERFRGIGLGSIMMAECVELLKKDAGNYSSAYLYVRPDNIPAKRVYEKVGFIRTEEWKDAEKMEILL